MLDKDFLTVLCTCFVYGAIGCLSFAFSLWLLSYFISQLIHFFKAISK